jgi:hypothetical protein
VNTASSPIRLSPLDFGAFGGADTADVVAGAIIIAGPISMFNSATPQAFTV